MNEIDWEKQFKERYCIPRKKEEGGCGSIGCYYGCKLKWFEQKLNTAIETIEAEIKSDEQDFEYNQGMDRAIVILKGGDK